MIKTSVDDGDAESKLRLVTRMLVLGQEVVKDKGYHDNFLLAQCARWGIRTYIPERKQESRTWVDKPEEYESAFRGNRRRVRSAKGRRLSRWRSEKCERSFAHVCETGGGRRAWLRGLVNVTKSYLMRCAGFNLGLILRKCFGLSKPRSGGRPTSAFLLLWIAAATWVSMTMRKSRGAVSLTRELLWLLVILSAMAPIRASLPRLSQTTPS